jgi:hypothetical protein
MNKQNLSKMCNFIGFEKNVHLETIVLQVLTIMIIVIAFFWLMTLCSYICGYLCHITRSYVLQQGNLNVYKMINLTSSCLSSTL